MAIAINSNAAERREGAGMPVGKCEVVAPGCWWPKCVLLLVIVSCLMVILKYGGLARVVDVGWPEDASRRCLAARGGPAAVWAKNCNKKPMGTVVTLSCHFF